jgi:hypothetical protein
MSIARPSRIAVIVCVVLLALLASPAPGSDGNPWPVKGKLIGKDDKKSEDVSGIACTTQKDFPRACLVIDDNLQSAQFVTVEDGKLVTGEPVKLIDDKFKDEALELDGEGVAFSKGSYYVIGSHGHPRDKKGNLDPINDADQIKARIAAASQIVRFRADEGETAKIERTANLRKLIATDPNLAPFMDRRLENNGLTIEGIAIKDDATLFAGFRGPLLDNNESAVVMSVPVDALFAGSVVQPKLFRLKLGGRGVRDLVAFEGGLLILAGPAADGPGTYAIYAWDGTDETVGPSFELTQFDPKRKPEGLLPLDRSGTELRVLILFDGDKEGAPTPARVK